MFVRNMIFLDFIVEVGIIKFFYCSLKIFDFKGDIVSFLNQIFIFYFKDQKLDIDGNIWFILREGNDILFDQSMEKNFLEFCFI